MKTDSRQPKRLTEAKTSRTAQRKGDYRAASCSAVWRREPPDSPGNWLAWTTKEWNGNIYGYMHCVCAYWSPTDNAPDKRIAWCVPWEMHEWEGALWSGPVNPPNSVLCDSKAD